MKKLITAAAALATTAISAGAHPGAHEMPAGQSMFHLLTQPDHLAMIVAVLALGAFIAYKSRRQA